LCQKERTKEKPLFFSFVSKEKNQKKTTIYWTVDGAWTPNGVQPHASSHQKQQKRKTSFPPINPGRSWFFFGTFFFTEKESTKVFLCFFLFH